MIFVFFLNKQKIQCIYGENFRMKQSAMYTFLISFICKLKFAIWLNINRKKRKMHREKQNERRQVLCVHTCYTMHVWILEFIVMWRLFFLFNCLLFHLLCDLFTCHYTLFIASNYISHVWCVLFVWLSAQFLSNECILALFSLCKDNLKFYRFIL